MKLRTPWTLSAAINEIKIKLTEKECARIVDRSESLIRKWADPDEPSLPNLHQSLVLDAAYVQAGFGEPPIQCWYVHRLERVVQEKPEDAIDIVMTTLHAQSAIGQIASAVALFAEKGIGNQGALSANERAVLLGLVEKLVIQLDDLEDALQANMNTSSPVFSRDAAIK